MENIKIYQNVHTTHVEGGEGLIYRLTTENGNWAAEAIKEVWYIGYAKDEKGKHYEIVWKVKDEFLNEDGSTNELYNEVEECDVCDWEKPEQVLCIEDDRPIENYEIIETYDKSEWLTEEWYY